LSSLSCTRLVGEISNCERNMDRAAEIDKNTVMDHPSGDPGESAPPQQPLTFIQKSMRRFDVAVTIAIAVTVAVLPIDTSPVTIATAVMLACWPFAGRWSERFETIKSRPVLWLPILLFAMFAIGTLYSAADWNKALERLVSYRKLLYPAIIATTLTVAWRRRLVLTVFQITMIVAFSFMVWQNVSLLLDGKATRLGSGFRNYMTTGLLIILWITQIYYFTRETRYRWWGAAVAGTLAFGLFTLNTARTIHAVLLIAILVGFIYRFRKRGIIIGLAAAILLPVTAYFVLPRFKLRVDEVFSEARDFLDRGRKHSSIGARMNLYRAAMNSATERPIFGFGTGGTVARLETAHGKPTDDPHNEYINMYMQLGVLGLGVFIAWLVALYRDARRMKPPWGPLAMTLAAIVAIACLPNSYVSVTSEGTMFLVFIGIFYSVPPDKKREELGRESAESKEDS